MTTWRFDPDALTNAELTRIQNWLKGNQIDHDNVPTDATIRIDGNQLTVDIFALRDGKKYLAGNGKPARTTATVRLLVPVPRGLKSLKPAGATP